MIRPARKGDAVQLAELLTQLGYPTSGEEMAGRMHMISRDETFATFVAAEGNDVLGMIGVSDCPSYEHNDRNGRIIALVVRADVRRRGLGRELIHFAEDYLAQKKVGRIVLTSRFTREDAHKFYESLGYARTGLRFMKELAAR